ncbi:hypothetical protein BGZ68_005793 [Mortierella alpina]|nr:hypothetical protein BGZ68_005793 [Mortierella alpina]
MAQHHSSPENVRSVFWTNLILLGVQEYSSRQQGSTISGLGVPQSRDEASTPLQFQDLHHHQHIVIDTYSYGSTGATKPLELHRLMFAKGNQSTRALEFVLWFLFTRLDKALALQRFRDCWPVLDRHDAREMRNVSFKWLEELRKEGSFGIGNNMVPSEADTMARESGSSSVAIGKTAPSAGLGVFLPTIRRSYLDESIGERIEKLILTLSTFVLSRAVIRDLNRHQPDELNDNDGRLLRLVSKVPGSTHEEEALLEMIDSHIVSRSRDFIQEIEKQQKTRRQWDSMSREMTEKMDKFKKELDAIETERRTFMAHHHQLAERTTQLSYDELRILEDRWIEKIDGQWRPILSFVERNLDRKENLQSMLDSDQGNGSSVLNGRKMIADVADSPAHVQEHGHFKRAQGPNVDPVQVLLAWKRSLQLLGSRTSHSHESGVETPSNHAGPLEDLSSSHSLQLQRIRGSRKKLEIRLQEANRRVERLKRESNTMQRPYRRLLSTVPQLENRIADTRSPNAANSATQDAMACSRSVADCLRPSANDERSFSDQVQRLRDTLGASGPKTQVFDKSAHRGLHEALSGKDAYLMLSAKPSSPVIPYAAKTRPAAPVSPYAAKTRPAAPVNPYAAKTRPAAPVNPYVAKTKSTSPVNPYVAKTKPTSPVNPYVAKTRPTSPVNPYVATTRPTSPVISCDTNTRQSVHRTHPPKLQLQPERVVDRAVVAKPVLATGAIFSKSILQGLGASKKRRQSSDFNIKRYIPSTVQNHGPSQDTPSTPDNPQQTRRIDVFDSGLHETPETPSKRTKIDSFEINVGGRRATSNVELKTPVKERSVNNNLTDQSVPSSPSSRVLDRKRTLAVRSPKLTLDDLRAPTPKPIKISSVDGASAGLKMPIMFLHTPQQKKLYEMLADTAIPKLSRPFSALTPPSKSDDKLGRKSLSPKTKLKPSPFASSIFTRFKTSSGLRKEEERSSGLTGKAVPESPSASGLFLLDSPRAAKSDYPTSPLANKRPTRPLAASVRVNHLLTGNSVVLDRICSNDNEVDWHSHNSTGTSVEPKVEKVESVQRKEAQAKVPPTTPEKLARSDRKTEAVVAHVDLRASRNPWGRPPSWKPKSPRMIDMENKRLEESMAAKRGRFLPPPFEQLSKSNLGSLKVSVFGRSRNVSPPSSTPASFSSWSSLSSKSLHSDAGPFSSQSVAGRATGLGEPNVENASEDDPDDDEDNSRGFSPPAVSPLRMPRLSAHRSLTASMLSSQPRDVASFVLPKRIGRRADRIVKPVGRPALGKSRERTEDSSSRVQAHDAEAKRFLDEPMPQDPFLAEDQVGEDCTMLNSELQPIFSNNEATEGLLGEAMPEGLDPEEILWETTEAFT